jgi:hypothetical protein
LLDRCVLNGEDTASIVLLGEVTVKYPRKVARVDPVRKVPVAEVAEVAGD